MIALGSLYRIAMFEPTTDDPIRMASPAKVAMLACIVLVVVIGIYQGPFVRMATSVLATLGF